MKEINNTIKSHKKIKIICLSVVIILLLIAIAIGIYFFYNKNLSKNDNIEVEELEQSKFNIEKSETSYTGMRFKTTWTYLKEELDKLKSQNTSNGFNLSNWKKIDDVSDDQTTTYRMSYYNYRNPTVEELAKGENSILYDIFGFEVVVENNTDKIVAIAYDSLKGEDYNQNFSTFLDYLSLIDNELTNNVSKLISQLSEAQSENEDINNVNISTYYEDNIYVYLINNDTTFSIVVCPSINEEVEYQREYRKWKVLENLSNNKYNDKINGLENPNLIDYIEIDMPNFIDKSYTSVIYDYNLTDYIVEQLYEHGIEGTTFSSKHMKWISDNSISIEGNFYLYGYGIIKKQEPNANGKLKVFCKDGTISLGQDIKVYGDYSSNTDKPQQLYINPNNKPVTQAPSSDNNSMTLEEKIKELAIREETEAWNYTKYGKYATLQSSGNEIILVTYIHKYDKYEHYYMLIEVNTKENSIVKHTDVFPGNEGFIESMYLSNWEQ